MFIPKKYFNIIFKYIIFCAENIIINKGILYYMNIEKTQENIKQFKIESLKESFNFINSVINRCTIKGQFTLDEAYLIKLNLNNIYMGIDTLEKYQISLNDVSNVEIKKDV